MNTSPAPRGLPRRSLAAAVIALPALWLGARAQPAGARRPTPAQTEGPFYPVALPRDTDNDLLRNGTLTLRRRASRPGSTAPCTDLDGRPLTGAAVEIWQCDEAGHYHHPGDGDRADRAFQGFGRVAVDAQGRYRFRTIRPVPYTGRTPHIHVKVKLGPRELLTTQLYVAGAPGNARDFLWRSLSEDDARGRHRAFRARGGRLAGALPDRGRRLSLGQSASRPAISRSTRSQRAASDSSCVTITKAVPCSRASSSISANTPSAVPRSRLPVGSSASTQAGCVTSARAIATRWRSPPDSSAGRCCTRSPRPTAASICGGRIARLRPASRAGSSAASPRCPAR